MRHRHPAALSAALALSVALMGALGPAAGQTRRLEYVQLYGRVQRIGAEMMTVTRDCMLVETCTPVSVTFDLRRVPPRDYRNVRAGSWVLVGGVVLHEDGHPVVVATSVTPIEEWQAP